MSDEKATPGPDPVHLMTIEMGAWCGASGPGNGRASSAWREVTCTACLAKGTTWLRSLVWDMLQSMPASREALAFAVRAGRLGVTDERGRPLAMACAGACGPAFCCSAPQALHDSPGEDLDDGRHPDECPCQFCEQDRREAAAQDDEPEWDSADSNAYQEEWEREAAHDGDAEETAAILADPDTMAAIAEGEADL